MTNGTTHVVIQDEVTILEVTKNATTVEVVSPGIQGPAGPPGSSIDITGKQDVVSGVSSTEIGYLDGVTSGIQTQLNAKAPIASPTFTGTVSGITKSMVGLGNVDNTTDANKPVSTATQTALDLKAPLDSPTFTGTVTLAQAPTSDLHAATKIYVDNVTAGINFHQAVHVATTANLNANYNNGNSGIGATLISVTNGAWTTLDGHTSFTQYDRILVKNQTDPKQNGIYVLSDLGSGSSKWVLTRSTDADNNPTGEMKPGDFTFVQNGAVNASIGYINSSTASPIVIGTDNISYTEFNAGKTVIAGNGLQELTPGTFSIDTAITQARVSGVTDIEIGYLDGVTSAIQTQLDNKLESSDIAGLATETYVDTAVGNVTVDLSTAAGENIDWNATTSQFDAVIPGATPTTLGTVYGLNSTDASPGNNGIGYQILNSLTTGSWNTAIGTQAMYSNTTGQNNLALGNFSLYRNTTGYNNIAIGNNAGYGRTDIPNSGSYSTIIGVDSGADAIASGYNTIIGSESGNNLSGGSHIAIGNQATDQGSGDGSIGIGYWTYFNAGNISNCIAIGNKALQFNDIDPGSSYIGENIGIGTEALAANTTGKFNVAIGRSAGSIDSNSNSAPLANAGFNTIIGSYAGRSITGGKNVIIGFSALGYANDSGVSPSTVYTSTGTNNIIIGTQASPSSSSVSNEITLGNSDITKFRIPGLGIDWTTSTLPWKAATPTTLGTIYGVASQGNTAIGYDSFKIGEATSGFNSVFGIQAGQSITTGSFNSIFGDNAMANATNASSNCAFGSDALLATFSGQGNTAIGDSSLVNSTGSYNTALGKNAGNNIVSGQNNIAIGYNSTVSSNTVSNTVTLGNSSITTLRCQVTSITGLSDERDKKDIEPLNIGLDFVNKLNPVKFQWNMRDGGKVDVPDSGFIAQELVEAEDETGLADYLMLTFRDNPEKLEASAGRLIPILVKAIQDLSDKVKALEEKTS